MLVGKKDPELECYPHNTRSEGEVPFLHAAGLVHHARLVLKCTKDGQKPPANERQSRQLSDEGTPLKKQQAGSSYEHRLELANRYHTKLVTESSPAKRGRLLRDLHHNLNHLGQKFGISQTPAFAPAQVQMVATPAAVKGSKPVH